MNPYTITEHDCATGIETTREMTPEEIALLPEATDEAPATDA
ncbi:hypothetical protein UFOVP335_10 [uncultured Caudovirales phage]|uniref:Uncharacterized protein n=1 Tax=uncultured Caudovirales phage TaxID=2100421 RepID=A0A6J5LW40_9CAUD|nr:hypothetical protein UFOVP335_10 [uncultured Caudovirales phage]